MLPYCLWLCRCERQCHAGMTQLCFVPQASGYFGITELWRGAPPAGWKWLRDSIRGIVEWRGSKVRNCVGWIDHNWIKTKCSYSWLLFLLGWRPQYVNISFNMWDVNFFDLGLDPQHRWIAYGLCWLTSSSLLHSSPLFSSLGNPQNQLLQESLCD